MQRVARDWLVLTPLTHHHGSALGSVMGLRFAPHLLRTNQLFANATDHGQQVEIRIFVARDAVERHGKQNGADDPDQAKHNGPPHLEQILADAYELCSNSLAATHCANITMLVTPAAL
jgi:hypothetical protein